MSICNGGGFLHSYMTSMNVCMGRCVPQPLALKACATVYAQLRLHASVGEGKPEFVFGVRAERRVLVPIRFLCSLSRPCSFPPYPFIFDLLVYWTENL